MAHARLRVIDVSERADQPFWSDDGQIALVYNGEIYNFQGLREGLEALGHRFTTSSDTEVIVRTYEQGGRRALEALDGMFALALFDARTGELVLMRDRVGKTKMGRTHIFALQRLCFCCLWKRVGSYGKMVHPAPT